MTPKSWLPSCWFLPGAAGPSAWPLIPAVEPSLRRPSVAAVTATGAPVAEDPGPGDFELVVESPAVVLARKERRERQNINVTLYVASLLLVAAGALFVGTSLPAVLRFAGVCLITALFYGAGLAVHVKAPRLRPAAVAFAGTGLALVSVAGLAMYNFTVLDAPLAWFLTSMVGTLAYVVAALRLDNRVLVYLSLTFVVSTAWSGVSVLGAPLVWYFAAMIGFAAATTLLSQVKPGWVPPMLLRPLMQLDPFVVPAVALAAVAGGGSGCASLHLRIQDARAHPVGLRGRTARAQRCGHSLWRIRRPATVGPGTACGAAVVRTAHRRADVRLVRRGRSVLVPDVGPSVLHVRAAGADRRRPYCLCPVEAGAFQACAG